MKIVCTVICVVLCGGLLSGCGAKAPDYARLAAEQSFSVPHPDALEKREDPHMFTFTGSFPEDYTQIWHTSSYISGGSNYVGFGNAETDALIDSIKYTLDDSKRIPMEKELQRIIYEEQPYVILYSTSKKNIFKGFAFKKNL